MYEIIREIGEIEGREQFLEEYKENKKRKKRITKLRNMQKGKE